MIKPTKKYKKMRVQPEIIELYKNKEFISDSLSTTSISSVRFTADGQKTTRVLGMVADRHLLAELKLPELHERCAIAKNKDLYKLSQMLAEPEVSLETAKFHKAPVPPATPKEELAEMRVHRKLHKMPWRRNELTDNESEYHKTMKQKDKVSRKVLEPFKDTQPCADISLSFTKEKHKKKKSKQERKNLPPDSSDDGSFLSAKDKMEEEPTKRQVRNECRAEVSPTKLKSMYIHENRLAISNFSDLSPQKLVKKFEIDPVIFRLLREKFQQALQIAKQLARIIDDWHAFTLLLFLGTFTYLIYILYYDINEYVNEERRYKLTMNEAGMFLKCFYYVMRLLKVPIF